VFLRFYLGCYCLVEDSFYVFLVEFVIIVDVCSLFFIFSECLFREFSLRIRFSVDVFSLAGIFFLTLVKVFRLVFVLRFRFVSF